MSFAAKRHPSRQMTGITTVVVLHAVIIYALATGLGRQVVDIVRAPLETRLIDDVKPPPEKVKPPPPPKLAMPPPPFVPLPDFKVQAPVANNAIRDVTTVKPPEPAAIAAPVTEAVHVPAAVNPRKPCASPDYPALSKRLEESGTVVLSLLVDADGKVVDSKIEQSTGFSRLDNAARAAVQLCQFTPGTVDGKPEQSWARYRYNFTLQQ